MLVSTFAAVHRLDFPKQHTTNRLFSLQKKTSLGDTWEDLLDASNNPMVWDTGAKVFWPVDNPDIRKTVIFDPPFEAYGMRILWVTDENGHLITYYSGNLMEICYVVMNFDFLIIDADSVVVSPNTRLETCSDADEIYGLDPGTV